MCSKWAAARFCTHLICSSSSLKQKKKKNRSNATWQDFNQSRIDFAIAAIDNQYSINNILNTSPQYK